MEQSEHPDQEPPLEETAVAILQGLLDKVKLSQLPRHKRATRALRGLLSGPRFAHRQALHFFYDYELRGEDGRTELRTFVLRYRLNSIDDPFWQFTKVPQEMAEEFRDQTENNRRGLPFEPLRGDFMINCFGGIGVTDARAEEFVVGATTKDGEPLL